MSTRTTEDGLTVTHKGRGDHRISKGSVGARTEPKPTMPGDISLWRFVDGQRYSLFLTTGDAYDLADTLDALLDYIEEHPEQATG
jgi:hypothetical protein